MLVVVACFASFRRVVLIVVGSEHFVLLEVLPVAVGKIGDAHWAAAFAGRALAEFGEARPFGGIIDVDVERQPVSQTVDEAAVHGIVHFVWHLFAVSFAPEFRCFAAGKALHFLQGLFASEDGLRVDRLERW